VAQRIGWHLSPPVAGGGPVQAILSSEPNGEGLAADFLSQIKGVSRETILENAREGSVRVPETSETVTVRVLDPILLLAGKIRNAVDIEQNQPDKPRQDVKHARYPGAIHWQELIPPRIRQLTFEQDVQTSLRQLTGIGQSRGISI
jgi:hypothetical protein